MDDPDPSSKGGPARIRAATAADLAAIEACARAAYQQYVARIGKAPAPMVADFQSRIAARQVHVYADRGRVLGYVVFYPRGERVHLENVAVTPSHAGQGVGRRLIGFVEQQARDHGFEGIELYTNAKMVENLVLYPRLGYDETGRRHEDGFDRVYFYKHL